jgi:hypothetical protein
MAAPGWSRLSVTGMVNDGSANNPTTHNRIRCYSVRSLGQFRLRRFS